VVIDLKQSILFMVKRIFPISEILRRFTFKTMTAQDNYALLAVENHQLSDDIAVVRDKCTHFWEEIVLNAYHSGRMAEQYAKRTTRPK